MYIWKSKKQTVEIYGELLDLEDGVILGYEDEDIFNDEFLKSSFLKGYLKKYTPVSKSMDEEVSILQVDEELI